MRTLFTLLFCLFINFETVGAHVTFQDIMVPEKKVPISPSQKEKVNKLKNTRVVSNLHMDCNRLQIHLARSDVWGDMYLGYGVSDTALREYKNNLRVATQNICANDTVSLRYTRAINRIRQFRSDVDERNAELLGVSVDAAARYRIAELGNIDRHFARNCFPSTAAASGLQFTRFPLTPDLGLGQKVSAPSAALGNCGSGSSSGGGGPTMPDMATSRTGLAGVSQCLAEYATQANDCNNPAGLNATEAREKADEATASCLANGNCVAEQSENNDGTTSHSIAQSYRNSSGSGRDIVAAWTEDADGNITKFSMTMTRQDGPNNVMITNNWSLDTPEPPSTPAMPTTLPHSMTAEQRGYVSRYNQIRRLADIVGIDMQVIPIPPGTVLQCESFTTEGRENVTFTNVNSASDGREGTGGFSNPLISPDDAIGSCLCSGGRHGEQLANSMGYSCGGRGEDVMKRNFCMRAGGMRAESDQCTTYAKEDAGRDIDVSAMCSAVIQCPSSSIMAGSVVDSRLQCGCGRSFAAGSRGSDQCSNVRCPGPGAAMTGIQNQCCLSPRELVATPRMITLEALKLKKLRSFDTALPETLQIPQLDRLEQPLKKLERLDHLEKPPTVKK